MCRFGMRHPGTKKGRRWRWGRKGRGCRKCTPTASPAWPVPAGGTTAADGLGVVGADILDVLGADTLGVLGAGRGRGRAGARLNERQASAVGSRRARRCSLRGRRRRRRNQDRCRPTRRRRRSGCESVPSRCAGWWSWMRWASWARRVRRAAA
jgi:hypothetical protein